ncbi:MAG: LPS export ABC transporter permease LptF [Wenzhouxiangellaceae bacterium]
MILRSYLITNVARPFLAMLAFLTLLFTAWGASRLIGEGGAVSMTLGEFLRVIGLRSQIALEMIIPVTLFLSVVSALGRMAAAQEFVALRAIGGSTRLLLSSVGLFALLAALLIGAEAIMLRPLAYGEIYRLNALIGEDINISRVEAGRFYTSTFSNRVVFAAGRDDELLQDVFVQRERNGRTEFIFANQAEQVQQPDGGEAIDFTDGYLYQITYDQKDDWHINFRSMRLLLEEDEQRQPAKRYKSTATHDLLDNPDPAAVAELQSRLTTPLVTLMLALLAVPLSRFAPRGNRYGRMLFSVVVLIAYLNLYVIMKNWVREAEIPPWPGLYWVPLLLLITLTLLLLFERINPRGRRRRKT